MVRTAPARLLGHDFAIEVDDDALVAHLDAAYAHLPRSHDSGASLYTLSRGDEGWRVAGPEVVDGDEHAAHRALATLLWSLNRSVSATAGAGVLLLHAGLVAIGDRGVVVCAPPDHGKSTLVTGLSRRGARYGGDEFVALDLETGLVHPVPRPPVIEGTAKRVFHDLRPACADPWFETQWLLDPNQFGGGILLEPVRPAAIVVPTYVPHLAADLKPISPGEALVMLVRQSFNLRAIGRRGFHAAAGLVRAVEARALRSGDLDASCAAVEHLVAA